LLHLQAFKEAIIATVLFTNDTDGHTSYVVTTHCVDMSYLMIGNGTCVRYLGWLTCVVICAAILYVISYAPVYRWHQLRQNRSSPIGAWRKCFRPIETLIDFTSLKDPLLRWGAMWRVRDQLETDSALREIRRVAAYNEEKLSKDRD
jgi:hypothetical protein